MLIFKNKQQAYVVGIAFRCNKEGKHTHILVINKLRPKWQAGFTSIPGGKVEPNETAIEAIVREFKEETGITTTELDWQLTSTKRWPTAYLNFYTTSLEEERYDTYKQNLTDECITSINLKDIIHENKIYNLELEVGEASFWLPDDPCKSWVVRKNGNNNDC